MRKAIVGCIMGLVLCIGFAKAPSAMEFEKVKDSDCRNENNYHNRSCQGWSQLFELKHPSEWDRARENREPRHRWYGKREVSEKIIVMVLEGVQFDFDKSDIKPTAIPKLDRNVEQLKAMKLNRINVIGYTDSKGTEEYNQKLSERRAQAVKDYLVQSGIASNRILVEGRGESGAVAPNTEVSGADDPVGRAKNRRAIELQIWME